MMVVMTPRTTAAIIAIIAIVESPLYARDIKVALMATGNKAAAQRECADNEYEYGKEFGHTTPLKKY